MTFPDFVGVSSFSQSCLSVLTFDFRSCPECWRCSIVYSYLVLYSVYPWRSTTLNRLHGADSNNQINNLYLCLKNRYRGCYTNVQWHSISCLLIWPLTFINRLTQKLRLRYSVLTNIKSINQSKYSSQTTDTQHQLMVFNIYKYQSIQLKWSFQR